MLELCKPPFMVYPWNPDKPGPGEDILATIFTRLHKEDLYSTIFHENPTMTFSQYVHFFTRPNVLLQLCLTTDEAGNAKDIAGFAYLSDFDQLPSHRRAAGSFCFFRDYQTPKWTSGFVPLMFGYWFGCDGLALDVLSGMTPTLNRPALAFCKRIGLKYIVDVPGYSFYKGEQCDVGLAIMTRADYERKYQKRL